VALIVTRPALAGGIFRAALAGVLVTIVPLIFPSFARFAVVAWAYGVWTLVQLALIQKDKLPTVRPAIAGLVDYAIVTAIVHQLGSVRTTMVLLYFVSGTLYAFAVSYSTVLFLAAAGSLFYAAIVFIERVGILPFAPASPDVGSLGQPPLGLTVFGVGMGAALHFCLVLVVATLVRQVRAKGDDLAAANRQLQDLSERDPLTGLYNRRYLLLQLEREMARARRGATISVLMLDLDRFKHINDTEGHLRGDLLLQRLAQELTLAVRTTDVLARYGGDEIVALLPDTSHAEAAVVSARLLAAAKRVGLEFDPLHPVTASIGHAIASSSEDGPSFLRRADERTYAAKRGGGDAVVMEAGDAGGAQSKPPPSTG
jgi:diguanylate cyclase (GGDEF)-like protein